MDHEKHLMARCPGRTRHGRAGALRLNCHSSGSSTVPMVKFLLERTLQLFLRPYASVLVTSHLPRARAVPDRWPS